MDLVTVIQILHGIFVVYMVVSPFFFVSPAFSVVYFWISTSVIVHWFLNNKTCALTIIETKLTGKEEKDSFIYRVVAPIYDVSHYITDEQFRKIVRLLAIALWFTNICVLYWHTGDDWIKYIFLMKQ